jgi:hypothetical protein
MTKIDALWERGWSCIMLHIDIHFPESVFARIPADRWEHRIPSPLWKSSTWPTGSANRRLTEEMPDPTQSNLTFVA